MKFLSIFLLLISLTLFAVEKPITQVNIIFDASGSMWGKIKGDTKIKIARKAMKDLLKEFEGKDDTYLGLRVYGHLNKKCSNSIQEVKPGQKTSVQIEKKIKEINPTGKTPIASSLIQSINDFNPNIKGEKVIVLITDGLESCGGNTCDAALKLKKAGIVTKVHVVGFGLDAQGMKTLECIAKPSDGVVLSASNAKELVGAFKKITKNVSQKRNLQVIGMDGQKKGVYMDVYVLKDGKKIKSTEGVDPFFAVNPGVYDIKVVSRNTKTEIFKKEVSIPKTGKKIVKIIFENGVFKLNSKRSSGKNINVTYQFYQNKKKLVSKQGKGLTKQVLLPGVYDISAYQEDTYTTLWKKNINLKAGTTVDVDFNFDMGTIKLIPTGKKYWWYYFFKDGSKKRERAITEGVGPREIKMSPGTYIIKVINDYNKVVKVIKDVKVVGGKEIEINVKF